jgi:hypothetical protein
MRVSIVIGILLLVLVVPIVGIFVGGNWVERQRIADADPAFRPLIPLHCEINDSPGPFGRYCLYVVQFTPKSKLTYGNVSTLESLNLLPPKNTLCVYMTTPEIDDSALTVLKSLRTVDSLDVTGTRISDDGIQQLKEALPECDVVTRGG